MCKTAHYKNTVQTFKLYATLLRFVEHPKPVCVVKIFDAQSHNDKIKSSYD